MSISLDAKRREMESQQEAAGWSLNAAVCLALRWHLEELKMLEFL